MCGIAGIFHYGDQSRRVDEPTLRSMARSLAHRGPDAEGVWSAPGIGLGHRRLSILDLSDAALQPMTHASRDLHITYNGEVYNFRELRERLTGLGQDFHTTSDTEVVLAAYAEWGEDVVEKISGIFSFAIWDGERRRLFMARDPIGVKPLFYSFDGSTLWFGSEIKAILTDPQVGREFDEEALDAFFTFSYTPAPATGFRRIRQLLPGHYAIVDGKGLRERRYWNVPYSDQPRSIDFASAVDEFTEQLDRITAAQLVSDVPVGAFLSGGLDSAAIVRAMTRARMGPVRALTVGFDVPGYDERKGAGLTAAALGVGVDHQEVAVDSAALLPELSRHMEEPTADSSMIPVFLLCREARRRFTVAMSGDGADELLAGYDTYRAAAWAARYRMLPGFIRRGVIQPLSHMLPVGDRKYDLHQVATRFTYGAELGAGRDHCAWRIIFHDHLKDRLYTAEFRNAVRHCDPVGRYAAHIADVPPTRGRLDGLLNADTAFYLPNDMLVKVDRMSMANGLEVRVPFLDKEMVRFCADLPAAFKLYRRRIRKHILRESLRRSLPKDILSGRKSGFNVPLGPWMRGALRELLFDTMATQRDVVGRFLDRRRLERVADEHRAGCADHAHVLFTVLLFALWVENAASAWRPATTPLRGVAVGKA